MTCFERRCWRTAGEGYLVETVFLFYNIFTLQESFIACWADFVEVEWKDVMEKASMGLMEEITGRTPSSFPSRSYGGVLYSSSSVPMYIPQSSLRLSFKPTKSGNGQRQLPCPGPQSNVIPDRHRLQSWRHYHAPGLQGTLYSRDYEQYGNNRGQCFIRLPSLPRLSSVFLYRYF